MSKHSYYDSRPVRSLEEILNRLGELENELTQDSPSDCRHPTSSLFMTSNGLQQDTTSPCILNIVSQIRSDVLRLYPTPDIISTKDTNRSTSDPCAIEGAVCHALGEPHATTSVKDMTNATPQPSPVALLSKTLHALISAFRSLSEDFYRRVALRICTIQKKILHLEGSVQQIYNAPLKLNVEEEKKKKEDFGDKVVKSEDTGGVDNKLDNESLGDKCDDGHIILSIDHHIDTISNDHLDTGDISGNINEGPDLPKTCDPRGTKRNSPSVISYIYSAKAKWEALKGTQSGSELPPLASDRVYGLAPSMRPTTALKAFALEHSQPKGHIDSDDSDSYQGGMCSLGAKESKRQQRTSLKAKGMKKCTTTILSGPKPTAPSRDPALIRYFTPQPTVLSDLFGSSDFCDPKDEQYPIFTAPLMSVSEDSHKCDILDSSYPVSLAGHTTNNGSGSTNTNTSDEKHLSFCLDFHSKQTRFKEELSIIADQCEVERKSSNEATQRLLDYILAVTNENILESPHLTSSSDGSINMRHTISAESPSTSQTKSEIIFEVDAVKAIFTSEERNKPPTLHGTVACIDNNISQDMPPALSCINTAASPHPNPPSLTSSIPNAITTVGASEQPITRTSSDTTIETPINIYSFIRDRFKSYVLSTLSAAGKQSLDTYHIDGIAPSCYSTTTTSSISACSTGHAEQLPDSLMNSWVIMVYLLCYRMDSFNKAAHDEINGVVNNVTEEVLIQ
eukprot:Tbor_TRINITY_DN5011_c0_g7::TRINITY_DN5011_c0_g7_i1::g.14382::m.14382